MKKQPKRQRLVLDRTTVRQLSREQLQRAAGAMPDTGGNSETNPDCMTPGQ